MQTGNNSDGHPSTNRMLFNSENELVSDTMWTNVKNNAK